MPPKKKATAKEVMEAAKAIGEDIVEAMASPPPKSDERPKVEPVAYETVDYQDPRPSRWTQAYDAKGKWLGFFPDDETAKSWVKRTKQKGVTINHTPPVRKIRRPV